MLQDLAQVSSTTLRADLALLPLKARPFLHRRRDLADAEQADHGDQEVEALEQRLRSRRPSRSWPVTVSMPTAARANPRNMAAIVFVGELLAHADEAAEGQQLHGEELGRAELEREPSQISGARNVISITANSADEGRGERGGQRLRRAVPAAPSG